MTPQETDPALPVSVQESLAEAWVRMTCFRVRGAESWSQVKQQGENTVPLIKQIHVILHDDLDGIERNQNKPN